MVEEAVEPVVVESQIVETPVVPTTQSEVGKKKKEKKKEEKKEKVRGKTVIQVKNPNKYDIKKSLSGFTAPEVTVFGGDVPTFQEHLIS